MLMSPVPIRLAAGEAFSDLDTTSPAPASPARQVFFCDARQGFATGMHRTAVIKAAMTAGQDLHKSHKDQYPMWLISTRSRASLQDPYYLTVIMKHVLASSGKSSQKAEDRSLA